MILFSEFLSRIVNRMNGNFPQRGEERELPKPQRVVITAIASRRPHLGVRRRYNTVASEYIPPRIGLGIEIICLAHSDIGHAGIALIR